MELGCCGWRGCSLESTRVCRCQPSVFWSEGLVCPLYLASLALSAVDAIAFHEFVQFRLMATISSYEYSHARSCLFAQYIGCPHLSTSVTHTAQIASNRTSNSPPTNGVLLFYAMSGVPLNILGCLYLPNQLRRHHVKGLQSSNTMISTIQQVQVDTQTKHPPPLLSYAPSILHPIPLTLTPLTTSYP